MQSQISTKPVTLSLDTNIYASGDVLADTQEITACVPTPGGRVVVQSIVLNDKDDQGQALDLVFLKTAASIGTENSAVSVSDTNADQILGIVSVASDDWIDLGGCRVATKANIGLVAEAGPGSTSVFVAAISRGTGTYTASGITLSVGLKDASL